MIMTEQELNQLDARVEKLWQEMAALEKPYNAKCQEWSEAWNVLRTERERAKLRAEILAEQKVA